MKQSEPISPSPGSYNLRPLEGFNYFSPKYSFPKKTTNNNTPAILSKGAFAYWIPAPRKQRISWINR